MMPDVFSPKLYPADRRTSGKWFIKYFEKDYTAGKLKARKYYGLLNVEPDIKKREALAAQYIKMINAGEELPKYQGMKNIPAPGFHSNFASVAESCKKFLTARRHEIRKRTASQYTSRTNILVAWLHQNNLHQLGIGAITNEHVREFMNYLKHEKRVSNKTYNDYKSLFVGIWQEYVNDGKIKVNPWRKIKTLPNETQHLKSFPPELRAKIRKTLPGYDAQMWLFLQCIYYCAIRPHAELRLLKVKHLFIDQGLFFIPAEVSKTKKARMVNIYQDLLQQLKAKGYHQYNPEFYLFTREKVPGPMPVSINYFKRVWNDYKKLFEIPVQYKLYGSKHTGGKALSKLYNQYITQEHFGHSTQSATQHYINELESNELHFLQQDFPEF